MPYKPYWLQRLPEIIAALRGLPDRLIDRPTFETIFGLRRRRAIELMHSLGSCRGQRGYVLDRAVLLPRLRVPERSHRITAGKEAVRAERVIEQFSGPKASLRTVQWPLRPNEDDVSNCGRRDWRKTGNLLPLFEGTGIHRGS